MLTFKFACKWAVFIFFCPVICKFKNLANWAVSKKFITGLDQKCVCEIRIYLFGSYLRFKSLYTFLGIKPILFTPKSLKCPLKIENKGI